MGNVRRIMCSEGVVGDVRKNSVQHLCCCTQQIYAAEAPYSKLDPSAGGISRVALSDPPCSSAWEDLLASRIR